MRRLLFAVGLCLCAFAAPAEARPEMTSPSGENNRWYRFDSDTDRAPGYRSVRRSRSVARPVARPQARRAPSPHRRQVARVSRPRDSGSGSFLRQGAAGTSRACLTSAARALLGRIEGQFGAVRVISTCRPGARIAGTGRISRHASGNAVDFDAGGRKAAIVRWLISNHHTGGTMTYARMSHIHVDIGPRFVALNSGASYR